MAKRRNVPAADEQSLKAAPAAASAPASGAASASSTAWAPAAPPRSNVAEWLTVERLLWAGVISVALAVRVLDLARFALTDAEALTANGALAILHGDPEGALHVPPLVAGIDSLLFMIFGANDAAARILSTIAGLVPVVLTYRLRDALGRWGALFGAALFGLSPTFLFESRSANGDIVAVAGIFAVLVGAWTYLRRPQGISLYWIAVGLAVALTAGELGWLFVLVCATFALVVLALRRTQQLDTPEIDSAWAALKQSPAGLRHALIVFAIVWLAGATTALLNPLGLQSALNMAADLFARWTAPANQPASYFLQLLIVYEFLPLVFGLGGLFYYLARGDRFAPFLAWWLGLSLAWYTLAPNKSSGVLLFVLVPLMLVAGRCIGDLLGALRSGFSIANEGVFVVLGLLTCGIFGLNLSEYAQTAQQTHLLVAGVALLMLALIGALVGGLAGLVSAVPAVPGSHADDAGAPASNPSPVWRFNVRRAYSVLATVTLIVLVVLFLHASFNLSFNTGADPREPMVDSPTTLEARELKPTLEELSSRWEGDPHSVSIAADASIGPALSWYLRDFGSVHTYADLPPAVVEPIVITSASSRQPALDNYAMHKVRWRWLKPDEPLDSLSFLRWQLYRGIHDVPASFDIIVYAQMR